MTERTLIIEVFQNSEKHSVYLTTRMLMEKDYYEVMIGYSHR
jgi:hypothetical protein